MWRQARVHLDWLAEDSPGRAYAHDPLSLGGWLRCRPGGPLSGPSTLTRPATATTTRCSAASTATRTSRSSSRLSGFEWPVVPTGPFAPGTFNRRDYYLARLGPWARVVHCPRREGEEDTVAKCGRRIEGDRALAMVWPPPVAELGGLPWQWCCECWAGRCISRGDHENDLIPELE